MFIAILLPLIGFPGIWECARGEETLIYNLGKASIGKKPLSGIGFVYV